MEVLKKSAGHQQDILKINNSKFYAGNDVSIKSVKQRASTFLNNQNNLNKNNAADKKKSVNTNNSNIKISIVNKYKNNNNTVTTTNKTNHSNNNVVKNDTKNTVSGSDVKIRINQLNDTTKVTSPAKMSVLWNTSGWIRVYCGPDRSEFSCEDPSRMVHVASNSTTIEVVKDMALPVEYTLWVI